MEGSIRTAAVVAMQCQGVPHSDIVSNANHYITKFQNRLDKEFQEGKSDSIMGQLEDSEQFIRNLWMLPNLSLIMYAVLRSQIVTKYSTVS